ncbi:hypothetical protein NHX12_022708 [Muraenolepis orangiensis]|uniref:Family with sequence similarity 204 member A n=1 Tax=Muraenolepis orangiensis TaxID=630683 RepID=A0A9Q0IVA2_9TELE|nr:hypothetical protein NHX12_022708 [Muraenolepis orangiensis]
MYSGLLPKGVTESDLSSDDDSDRQSEEEQGDAPNCSAEHVSDTAGQTSLTEVQVDLSPADPPRSPTTDHLPGISQEMWQKFKELQKKKDELQAERRVGFEKQWDGLKQYFGVNDRFQPPASSHPLQSGLEESMESAIAEGDIGQAEQLSDRLATRELAVKIAQAADCRDYVQHKQEEEASRAAQKRKTVAWGFEAKKRWETKSNMGYM